MTNLSNNVSMEKSKVAWENFKSFLISMDMNTNKTVEMAFKKGFNEGFEEGFETATNKPVTINPEPKVDVKAFAAALKKQVDEKPRDYMGEAVAALEKAKKPISILEEYENATLPVEPEKPKKTGITRNVKTRTIRSEVERKLDGECAVEILRAAGREMALQDIIKEAHKRGRMWPANSASGYVTRAIEDGFNIEKAGYGFYKYKGEVL